MQGGGTLLRVGIAVFFPCVDSINPIGLSIVKLILILFIKFIPLI